jgi:amino acid permease
VYLLIYLSLIIIVIIIVVGWYQGWQGAVGRTYWTDKGSVRRGVALWWKDELNVAPLPDNHLFGFKI